MDGEARIEVAKSMGFYWEYIKKQKPYPRFNEGYGFQIGLKTALFYQNCNLFDCVLCPFDVYSAMLLIFQLNYILQSVLLYS